MKNDILIINLNNCDTNCNFLFGERLEKEELNVTFDGKELLCDSKTLPAFWVQILKMSNIKNVVELLGLN